MKKIISILLCTLLVALPIQAAEAEQDEPVKAQWWTLCVAAVAVVVIGTAAYVIYKCDRNAADREKCETCQNPNKKDANFCANCGTPIRCEDCETKLPKDAKTCPTCDTKVPAPTKPFTQVEMSTNGVTWTAVASGQKIESLTAMRFNSESEFSAWAYREDSTTVIRLPVQSQAMFRLKSD